MMMLNAIRRLDIDPPARREAKMGHAVFECWSGQTSARRGPYRSLRLAVPSKLQGPRPVDAKTYLVPPPSVPREEFSASSEAESASHAASHAPCHHSRD